MVTMTPAAAEKLSGILTQKGMAETHALRVFVKGGGCGGMQYGMTFDDQRREDDMVWEQHGLRLFVDPTSLFYIDGSNIDYIDNLMGGGFHIDNPQAVSGCGCGSSFRTSQTHDGQAAPERSCGH
ncbi:MAG: iron-sulfur cluster insertion protein ErpA [Caldilineaceae bacterium]|nr:iron-sulfur cluster insertion protein ErpA [Caldilineaceae bacterium]